MINQDQILSLLRSLLAIAGGWLVSKGLLNDSQFATLSGAIMAVAPTIWGILTHTETATVKAAERAPGVVKVVVDSQAKADELAPRDANGEPKHDKILSPKEDLAHVAALPGVTVMVGNKVVEPALKGGS